MTGDFDTQRLALELAWQIARLSNDEQSERMLASIAIAAIPHH